MKKALGKLAFVPFAYIMDKWRWNVFRGKINSSNYNEEWWKMRYLAKLLNNIIGEEIFNILNQI